jgi:hypothetical protein
MMKQKGRYFSVRMSAALLQQIDSVRYEIYGERTSRAEAIRRLLEAALREGPLHHSGDISARYCTHLSCDSAFIPNAQNREFPFSSPDGVQPLLRLSEVGNADFRRLVEEVATLAIALRRLITRSMEAGVDTPSGSAALVQHGRPDSHSTRP